MIPAEFDYVAPASLEEAIGALSDGGEDAKLLAGGHSLLPLMKLRLAAPSLLVDLRRVDGLAGVRRNGALSVGALTTHAALAGAGARAAVGGGGDDRRSPGPPPGDDRRLARPRRPGVRPARGRAGGRGRRSSPAGRTGSGRLPRRSSSATTSRPRSAPTR